MEIDKVALVCIRNRKLLMTRSKGKDVYYLPGGKREGKESDIETLKREILEELSCQIDESSIEYFGTFFDEADGKTGIRLKSICYIGNINKTPNPSGEVEKIEWIGTSNTKMCTENGKAIIESLKRKDLID